MRTLIGGSTLAAVLIAVSLATSPAGARPQYAAREGMYCGSCHLDPAGGGMRNGNGFSYARGRHAWEVEPKFEEWKAEPEIAKGVRVGGDIRYQGMALRMKDHYSDEGDQGEEGDSNPTLSSNYAMQGAAYLALMPIEKVVLYYSHDVGAGSQKQRDWWGMIRNLTSLNLYVKAGQIRPPYGIRTEDHTPFVRALIGNPPGETGIMDVDPRYTLPGIEAGLHKDAVFAHVAFQDPGSTFSPTFTKFTEKLVTARAGIQQGHIIVGGSFRANGGADSNPDASNRSATRYGGFGMYGAHCFSIMAEVDAGQNKTITNGESDAAAKTNVLGGYLAGEAYVSRSVTLRGEINYGETENDATGAKPLVARRFGAGLEWNPLPFFRIGTEGRFVSNSNAARISSPTMGQDEMWGLGYAVFSF